MFSMLQYRKKQNKLQLTELGVIREKQNSAL